MGIVCDAARPAIAAQKLHASFHPFKLLQPANYTGKIYALRTRSGGCRKRIEYVMFAENFKPYVTAFFAERRESETVCAFTAFKLRRPEVRPSAAAQCHSVVNLRRQSVLRHHRALCTRGEFAITAIQVIGGIVTLQMIGVCAQHHGSISS